MRTEPSSPTRPHVAAATTPSTAVRPSVAPSASLEDRAYERRDGTIAAAIGCAMLPLCYIGLVVPYSVLIPSPRASDRKLSRMAQERGDTLAQRAGMARPNVFVHLSLPASTPAGSEHNGMFLVRLLRPEARAPIVLRRELLLDLSGPHLDCVIAHELGHIALKKPEESRIYRQSQQKFHRIDAKTGQATEYAADWFAMQLCGREQMLSLNQGDVIRQWFGEANTTAHATHPSPPDRVLNLQRSNETYLHLPLQLQSVWETPTLSERWQNVTEPLPGFKTVLDTIFVAHCFWLFAKFWVDQAVPPMRRLPPAGR